MKKMNDFKITQTIAEGFDNDKNLIYRLYLAKLKGYLSLRAQYIGKEKTREYIFENFKSKKKIKPRLHGMSKAAPIGAAFDYYFPKKVLIS